MYSLLVVDDEKIAIDSVNFIVKNAFENVKVCGSARNGEEAVEIALRQKPDIILMDICMSGMNGLEAIRTIKHVLPQTRFVVVSAYEQFEFAKQAFELNVNDYLLKPVNAQRLKDTIGRITTELDKEQQAVKRSVETKGKFDQALKILEHWLVYSVLLNKDPHNELLKYCELVGVTEKYGYMIIVSYAKEITNNNISTNFSDKDQFYKVLCDILKAKGPCLIGPAMQDKTLVYMFTKQHDTLESKEKSMQVSEEVLRELKKNSALIFKIGIGCVKELSQITSAYEEARYALRLVDSVCHYLDILPEQLSDIQPSEGYSVSSSIESIGNERAFESHNKTIRNAAQYIEENYNSYISLEALSQRLGLSTQYFCKLFKKEMGVNFVDYITKTRLEKAIEMMKEGGKSVKEICFLVGYSDPNYFSRIFKKYTEHSPSEFIKGGSDFETNNLI